MTPPRSRTRVLLAASAAALALAGCQSMSAGLLTGGADSALELRLAEAQARNDALAREVASLRASGGSTGSPSGVEPGRCYARIASGASAERRLIAPERQVARIAPAIYESRDERVLVREARTEYEVAPAVVETVIENVLVSEGYTERTVMPARFDDRAQPGAVREAYVRFEACRAIGAQDAAMCAVEEPARMGIVMERVMVEPERVRETEVPARYMRVRREVVREPARLVTREIPAEYETIRVQRLVQPAREDMVTTPAVYAQANDAGGTSGWVEVLCDTRENRSVVEGVQRALAAGGHDPGPVDGVFGPRTRAAMLAYQRAQSLSEGHLTRETVTRLGVAFRP